MSDPQLSPNGRQVAFVLTEIERESDEYRCAVYVVPTDGGTEPRRFTYGTGKDSAPRWSSDGETLLFVSDRGGKPQAHLMPAHGGEARRLTSVPNGASEVVWSPDGQQVAFISVTGVEPNEGVEDELVLHYTEAHFKEDGIGLKRGRKHLFVQDVDGDEARQLTDGEDDYCAPTWSPDGRYIAAVSQGPNRALDWASRIWLIPVEGGEARQLTPQGSPSHSPSFSPDGATLAYLGHRNPPDTGRSTHQGVWTVSLDGGEPVLLTQGWDRSADNDVNSDSRWGTNDVRPVWTPDVSRLLFLGSDTGAAHVYAVDRAGGEVEAVTCGERVVDAFSLAGDRLVYLAADLNNPGDLYSSALDGSGEVRLTRVNEEYLTGFTLSRPEEIRFESTEDTVVQGWVIKPAGYEEGVKYPLIVEVHGGPHTLYGYAYFLEFQVLAARGYGVLFTNPRGSMGYGQEFAVSIAKNWGGRDYEDILAAADWAESQPWVDAARIGITGGSYGGFMTNWVVGHTDRFKAAVTRRSVSNFSSFYGTSDIGPYFAEWQIGGTPWDNPEGYARMSPITYVREMRTPLLVIHSEDDHRCPIEQAEQLYVGLLRFGCETALVRFPEESHSLTRGGKPRRRVENLERVAAWFEYYMSANLGCQVSDAVADNHVEEAASL